MSNLQTYITVPQLWQVNHSRHNVRISFSFVTFFNRNAHGATAFTKNMQATPLTECRLGFNLTTAHFNSRDWSIMHQIIGGLYLALCLRVLVWPNKRPSMLFTNSRAITSQTNKLCKMGYTACLHPLILCMFHWCKQPIGPKSGLAMPLWSFHSLKCRASFPDTG